MAIPHTFAGSASGTTVQLDANFAYFAGTITINGGVVGINRTNPEAYGGRLVVSGNIYADSGGYVGAYDTVNNAPCGFLSPSNGVLAFHAPVGVERARIDASGNSITTVPASPPSLTVNGTMVMNLTSNTNLRISVRGSDGTTRVANITLA